MYSVSNSGWIADSANGDTRNMLEILQVLGMCTSEHSFIGRPNCSYAPPAGFNRAFLPTFKHWGFSGNRYRNSKAGIDDINAGVADMGFVCEKKAAGPCSGSTRNDEVFALCRCHKARCRRFGGGRRTEKRQGRCRIPASI